MGTILILGNSSGGLYDFRNELLLELLKEHRVIASLPDEVRTKALEEEGVEVVTTAINRRGVNPTQDLRLMRDYRKLMKQYQPDLVLTYTIKPNVYGGMAAGSLGIPYMATVTGLGSAFQKTGIFLKLIEGLYRTGLRKAACVFFQNSANRELFTNRGLVSGKQVLVNGSGVNLTRHTKEPYPQSEETHFLFVGRMMREKGIEEYLAAAEALHSEHIYFDTLGYCDEDYESLLAEKEAAGIIHQLGFHTEVHSYYKEASAIVMPTYHEGMSNVLMEAAATARPVIASNISGCREIFDDGVSGISFEPRSAEELTKALEKFLKLSTDERAAMGEAGRLKMEREFDRRNIVAEYMKEVHAVLLS